MKPLLLWMWLAQSADVATTCQALNSDRFVESNKLMPKSCKNIALVKGSVTGLLSVLVSKRHEHSKTSKWFVAIVASSGSVGASINIVKLNKD